MCIRDSSDAEGSCVGGFSEGEWGFAADLGSVVSGGGVSECDVAGLGVLGFVDDACEVVFADEVAAVAVGDGLDVLSLVGEGLGLLLCHECGLLLALHGEGLLLLVVGELLLLGLLLCELLLLLDVLLVLGLVAGGCFLLCLLLCCGLLLCLLLVE